MQVLRPRCFGFFPNVHGEVEFSAKSHAEAAEESGGGNAHKDDRESHAYPDGDIMVIIDVFESIHGGLIETVRLGEL